MPGRGRRFERGNAGGPGRPAGSLPLGKIREQVEAAWDREGCDEKLAALARDDFPAFPFVTSSSSSVSGRW